MKDLSVARVSGRWQHVSFVDDGGADGGSVTSRSIGLAKDKGVGGSLWVKSDVVRLWDALRCFFLREDQLVLSCGTVQSID